MKIRFSYRMEAIEWIAGHVDDEGQFEVLREQLNYNYIYTGSYFLQLEEPLAEVILLEKNKS